MLERNIIKSAGRTESAATDRLYIAVTGIGRGCGATLIASSLAFFFSEKGKSVTFIECAEPSRCNALLFDAAAMDKRFALRKFGDAYEELRSGRGIRNIRNEESGVNWLLVTPRDVEMKADLSELQKGRLIAGARDDVCVFDMGCPGGEWAAFLQDMDIVIAVLDPLPSKLSANMETFRLVRSLELDGPSQVIWIVNRMNPGVSRRQIKDILKKGRIAWLDEIEAKEFYADEYMCRFHWENETIRAKIKDCLSGCIDENTI